jgi:hypothetical protein
MTHLEQLENIKPELGADAEQVIGWSVTVLHPGEGRIRTGELASFYVRQLDCEAHVVFQDEKQTIASLGRSQESYLPIKVTFFDALILLALERVVTFHPEVYPTFYELCIKHRIPMANLRPAVPGHWRTILPAVTDESEGSGNVV